MNLLSTSLLFTLVSWKLIISIQQQLAYKNESNGYPVPRYLNETITTAPTTTTSQTEKAEPLPLCDDLFKRQILQNTTITRINIKNQLHKFTSKHLSQLVTKTNITHGGCWSPKHYCQVRQRIAVIVPFRERESHTVPFLSYMHDFLQKQHREYCIVFAEQVDKGQFNRAKLMNAGYDFVMNSHKYWTEQNLQDSFFFQKFSKIFSMCGFFGSRNPCKSRSRGMFCKQKLAEIKKLSL